MRRLGLVVLLLPAIAAASTKVNTTDTAYYSAVLAGPNGEWIVVYTSDGTAGFGVNEIARFDSHGVKTYGPAAFGYDHAHPPWDALHVAWTGSAIGWVYDTAENGTIRQIRFHMTDADGKMLTPSTLVSPPVPGDWPGIPNMVFAEGEFLVGYNINIIGGVQYGVALRRISAAGQLLTPEIPVYRSVPPYSVSNPFIARTSDRIFIYWAMELPLSGKVVIAARWYDASAVPVGPVLSIIDKDQLTPDWLDLRPALPVGADAMITYVPGTGGTPFPVSVMQVDTAGTITLGPAAIGESGLSLMAGLGLIRTPGGVAYVGSRVVDLWLRRASIDTQVLAKSSMFGDPPAGAVALHPMLAYRDRRYALVWDDDRERSGVPDVYFDMAPGYELFVIGAGADPAAPPSVRVLQPESLSGTPIASFAPYGAGGYGANVAAGDTNGDGVDQLLTGPGPGPQYGPQVRAFTDMGMPIPRISFYAYGTLRYGVRPASGNVDQGTAWEILTGPGPGDVFGPHVRAFRDTGKGIKAVGNLSFYAYQTLRYGVNVALGDLENDGFSEILTGPGPGAVFGSQLRGFDYDGYALASRNSVNRFVYPTARYGLMVAAGDTDFDDFDEIGCGPGPDPVNATKVVVLDDDGGALAEKAGSRFEAFPGLGGGVKIAFGQWFDRDIARELLVSQGAVPASTAEIRVYDDSQAGFSLLASTNPFPGYAYGASIASLHPGF